jgi:1-acyl-sn-glycerol-3-phosphate acyltransferase
VARIREPLPNFLLYHSLKWSIVAPIVHTYFRGLIHGMENIPSEDPLVIVSNHASNYDPPIISNCVRRPVAYMAKEELFHIPVFKKAIQLCGAYPVSRGSADRQAIRDALKFLDNGWAVGLFLEGTRTPTGRIINPKRGAALIAAKAKVPILPVCLWGTQEIEKNGIIPRPVAVTVRIGKLIDAPTSTDKDELEAITQKCADTINSLHDLGR